MLPPFRCPDEHHPAPAVPQPTQMNSVDQDGPLTAVAGSEPVPHTCIYTNSMTQHGKLINGYLLIIYTYVLQVFGNKT